MPANAGHVLGDVGPREPATESLAAAEAEPRSAGLEGGPELRIVREAAAPGPGGRAGNVTPCCFSQAARAARRLAFVPPPDSVTLTVLPEVSVTNSEFPLMLLTVPKVKLPPVIPPKNEPSPASPPAGRETRAWRTVSAECASGPAFQRRARQLYVRVRHFVIDGSDGVWTRLAPPARPHVPPVLSGRAGGARHAQPLAGFRHLLSRGPQALLPRS